MCNYELKGRQFFIIPMYITEGFSRTKLNFENK